MEPTPSYIYRENNNNKGHYINDSYNKKHPFKIISLKNNFLINDNILIILLFQLIKLNSNTIIVKDKYKKINIQLNSELN